MGKEGMFINESGNIFRFTKGDEDYLRDAPIKELFNGVRYGSPSHEALVDNVLAAQITDKTASDLTKFEINKKRLYNREDPEIAQEYDAACSMVDELFAEATRIPGKMQDRLTEMGKFLEEVRNTPKVQEQE